MADRWSDTRNQLNGSDHRLVDQRGKLQLMAWRQQAKWHNKNGITNEISQIITDKGIISERQGQLYTYQDQLSGAAVLGHKSLAEPDRGWCDL